MIKRIAVTAKKSHGGRVRRLSPDLGSIDFTSSESTERQIYRLLRKAIMSGAFGPGAAMTTRSIAEVLGVSPSPVRDALKRLEADEAIEGRQKSAYFIRLLSPEDYWDILNIRLQLEGYAVRTAAQLISDSEVGVIEDINRQYSAAAANIPETLRLNFLFHFRIYRLCQSQRLINLIENLWTRIGPTMHYHTIGYDTNQVAENHSRLIEALRQRKPKAAQRALERDLTDAAKAITPRLPRGQDSGQIIPFPHSALDD